MMERAGKVRGGKRARAKLNDPLWVMTRARPHTPSRPGTAVVGTLVYLGLGGADPLSPPSGRGEPLPVYFDPSICSLEKFVLKCFTHLPLVRR